MFFPTFRVLIVLSICSVLLSMHAMDLGKNFRLAAYNGDMQEIQMLICARANVNAQSMDGQSGLLMAIVTV